MTKLPIPQDWDGETWECVQIQWPRSTMWLAVLVGLITTPGRGRLWDERTGTITEVQDIASKIAEKNLPVMPCAGCDETPETITLPPEIVYIGVSGGDGLGIEDDMSWVCGVNPSAFKIVDGVLSVKNFCGDWVEIGEVGTGPGDVVDPVDLYPGSEPDPEGDYYACGKVASLQTYLLALSDAFWASYADVETVEATTRAAVPMATLSRARIYQIAGNMVILDNLGMNDEMFNLADVNQLARCQAVEDVEDTAEGTGDERGVIVEAMASAYYNEVGIMTKSQWFAYWHSMAECIGDQDCRLIMTMGATNADADCDCPTIVEASTIYFDGTHSAGNWANTSLVSYEVLNGGRRVKITVNATLGDWREFSGLECYLAGHQVGDNIRVRYYPATPSLQFLTAQWQTYTWATLSPEADWYNPAFGGPTNNGPITIGEGWVERATLNSGSQNPAGVVAGGRFYPSQSPGQTRQTSMIYEIVAVNDTEYTPIGP